METQEYQKLVQTLMSSHLAASASEAQRMAKEMLGISKKVYDDSKKQQHYMIKGFKPQTEHVSQASGRPDVDMATGLPTKSSNSQLAVEPKIQQKPLQPETKTSMPDPANLQGSASFKQDHMQDKINELREHAINPEAVNVQVDFQTPNMDKQENNFNNTQKQDFNSSFPQNSKASSQSNIANTLSQDLTPEEYSANKFGKDSLNNLQSDFLSLKTPQQSESINNNSADWPTQETQQSSEPSKINNVLSAQANNSFNVNNTQQEAQAQYNESTQNNEMIQNFQEEAVKEKTQEIVSEQKKSRWTPEEEKLKKEVDLARVFNFSNK